MENPQSAACIMRLLRGTVRGREVVDKEQIGGRAYGPIGAGIKRTTPAKSAPSAQTTGTGHLPDSAPALYAKSPHVTTMAQIAAATQPSLLAHNMTFWTGRSAMCGMVSTIAVTGITSHAAKSCQKSVYWEPDRSHGMAKKSNAPAETRAHPPSSAVRAPRSHRAPRGRNRERVLHPAPSPPAEHSGSCAIRSWPMQVPIE
mmetsp:Transcript_36391/g.77610  ORF Transcript_36391/g.77610 Transcript_36391/m.77610 type:complete len:201 (-) Transcript_36391:525-1127(-)